MKHPEDLHEDNKMSDEDELTRWKLLMYLGPLGNLVFVIYMLLFRTFLGLIVLVLFVAAIFIVGYFNRGREAEQQALLEETMTYQHQMAKLDSMEANIRVLSEFVNAQKAALKQSEESLAQLKLKQQELRPLVQIDSAVVETIFKHQGKLTEDKLRNERWIGFGLGFAASLLASFISIPIVRLMRRRQAKTDAATIEPNSSSG